jgi:hypothetical protein
MSTNKISDPWLPGDSDYVPSNMPATLFTVYKIATSRNDLTEDLILDNVNFLWHQQRMGDDPGIAAFSYVFQDNGDPDSPHCFEQALDSGYTLLKTVDAGDRLNVVATRPDGVQIVIFDGHILDFGMVIDGDTEQVDFYGVGVAKTLWDRPIGGAIMRNADSPMTDGQATTDIVSVFNPQINGVTYGNCTPLGGDYTLNGFEFPLFIEPFVYGSTETRPRFWTLANAIRYIVFSENNDEELVNNPTKEEILEVLVAREPKIGYAFDPSDVGTYEAKSILAPTKPITGRAWPQVVHEFIRDKGFGMHFRISTTGEREPVTDLVLFVLQAGEVKDVWLPQRGSDFDARFCNLGSARVGRDLKQVVNSWIVDSALLRYEASFVLAPLFPMMIADSDDATSLSAYDKSGSLYQSGQRDFYRLYGFDETDDGHYAMGSGSPIKGAPDLSQLFGTKSYAIRRRIPRSNLITSDASGNPLAPRLDYMTGYTGPYPGLWDGSGGTAWKPIVSGWSLCRDRLGFRVTIDNPNAWSVGPDPVTKAQKILKTVEAQSFSGTNNFYFRLTCVIEGDESIKAVADRQELSPVIDTISRRIDARDRYYKEIIAKTSVFNTGSTSVIFRDDTPLAMAEAIANRDATQSGILDGEIHIPYITTYYEIGDRIRQVNGRGLGFRTDDGGVSSTPIYPIVEARKIINKPKQGVTLSISDESTARHSIERKINR